MWTVKASGIGVKWKDQHVANVEVRLPVDNHREPGTLAVELEAPVAREPDALLTAKLDRGPFREHLLGKGIERIQRREGPTDSEGEAQKPLVAGLIAPGGPYQVLFNVDDVLVAKRKAAG